MTTLKHIINGCKDLKHTGNHPGWTYLLIATVTGTVIGAHISPIDALKLGSACFLMVVPFHLGAAYSRSKAEAEIEQWIQKSKLN